MPRARAPEGEGRDLAGPVLLPGGVTPALSERERIALEMAAAGSVSGTLAEWPVLAAAFRVLGEDVPLCTGALELKARVREILDRPGRGRA